MSEKEIYRGTEVKKGNKDVEATHEWKEGEKAQYRGAEYKAHHEDKTHGHDMKYRGRSYKD